MENNLEDVNIKDMYLFDENPRYSYTKDSKKKLSEVKYEELTAENQIITVKRLLRHEGDFLDLYFLISSIIENGFIERTNRFIFMKIKSDDGKNKFLVTDGNRRLLALKIISNDFNISNFLSENDLKNKNVINIIKLINNFNNIDNKIHIMPNIFKSSYSFNKEEIDEMFKDINFNHTGSTSNGKRDWSRGKMLKEMYMIYESSEDISEAIKSISSDLLVSKIKAKSDLRSAVWFIEMLNIYNSEHESDPIDPLQIAPSSVELVLTVKLPKDIIEHENNLPETDTLAKLFTISISKDKKTQKYNISIDYKKITKSRLSNLIFDGYKTILKSVNNYETSFEDDVARENAENAGFRTNSFFSTRSWKNEGISELYDILDWPNGTNEKEKLSQIIQDNEKMFNLTNDEIDNYISKSSVYFKDNTSVIDLLLLLQNTPSLSAQPILSKSLAQDNHIFSVISITLDNEYKKLFKMSTAKGSQKPYSLEKKHIISQLSVLRAISELTQLLLIYTYINIYYEYDDKNAKINFNNNFSNALKTKGGIKSHVDAFNVFGNLFLKNDYKDLETIFSLLNEEFSGIPQKNFIMLNNFVENTILKDPTIDIQLKNKLIDLQKNIPKMNNIKCHIGKKISIPLHYFSKFVNEKDKKSLAILNSMFIEVYNDQIEFLKYLDDDPKNVFKDYEMILIFNKLM